MTLQEELRRGIDLHASKATLYEKQNVLNQQSRDQMANKVNATMDNWGISGFKTMTVGSGKDYPDIPSAWNALDGKVLKSDVLIKVSDGTHTTKGFTLRNQPYASRIRIEGNLTNPDNCIIKFVPDSNKRSHGVVLRNLKGLRIGGFKLVGETSASNLTYRCLFIGSGSDITINTNSIYMEGARIGLEIYEGSCLYSRDLRIDNMSGWSVVVGTASQARLHGIKINGRGKDTRTPRYYTAGEEAPHGILVADGASAWAHLAEVSKVHLGFLATRNSYFWCDSSVVREAQVGFVSQSNSTLWPHINNNIPAKAINCVVGFRAEHKGLVWCPGAVAENCTDSGFQSYSSSKLLCNDGKAVNCGKGYLSHVCSEIEASRTNANSTGNTTKYSPDASGVVGNTNSIIRWN